jgi:outer membrane protein OmpA-like peptidoglycan-associated protein
MRSRIVLSDRSVFEALRWSPPARIRGPCIGQSQREGGGHRHSGWRDRRGIIGNNTGSTARGAIIGAVVGGTAGAVIGHQMDQQAKELKLEIPGAIVERVGEGIQVTFASGLLYDFDSDVIRPEAGLNLRTLASSLKKYPDTQLLIVGHTDALGTTAYNQDLSARRASSASRYLTMQGLSSSRMQTSGKGELSRCRERDRSGASAQPRIEVAIFASEKTRTAAR